MPYISISRQTEDKVKLAKKFIEDKYQSLIQTQKQYHQNWKYIVHLMSKNNIPSQQQIKIEKQLKNQQQIKKRMMRQKDSLKNYQLYQLIGKGAFGQVRLAKNIHTNEIVAIKRMQKKTLANKKQLSSAYLERDFMIKNQNSKFLVHLYSTFQDKKYLYLVMEYIGGGDLLHLLIQKDIFTQQQTRFYIAELVLALEEIHSKNFIHRDIKPDNILIDRNGHIKISDFGLSKYLPNNSETNDSTKDSSTKQSYKQSTNLTHRVSTSNKSKNKLQNHKKAIKTPLQNKMNKSKFEKLKLLRENTVRKYSKVGTPDYISPEVLTSDTYDYSIDIWSVGVIMFQCLFGYPPFSDQNSTQVCQKVINWEDNLIFPDENDVSIQAKLLILGMMNYCQNRLTIKQIKKHQFFKDFDWDNMLNMKPPMIPTIQFQLDTRNFQTFQAEQSWQNQQLNTEMDQNVFQFKKDEQLTKDSFATSYKKQRKRSSSVDFAFAGFQYRRLELQPFKQIQNQIRNFRKTCKFQLQNHCKSPKYKQSFKRTQTHQTNLSSDKKKKPKYLIKSPTMSNKLQFKDKELFINTTYNSFMSKNINFSSVERELKEGVQIKKVKKTIPIHNMSKINSQKNVLKKKNIHTQIQSTVN